MLSFVAALLMAAPACRPRKVDECATVQAHMLEELRVADSLHDHLGDEAAVARHAQRLRAFSERLRAMDIQDASLRQAVERYLMSIDSLAGAYTRVARVGDAGVAPADAGAMEGGLVTLGALLSTHAAAVNGARSAITRACGGQ